MGEYVFMDDTKTSSADFNMPPGQEAGGKDRGLRLAELEGALGEPSSSGDEGLGTIEERARRMGWLPLEEFPGNPDRWVDAETYVRNAETQLPILKGTLGVMERKMAEQERLLKEQAERIARMQADFREFVEFTRKSEERAYKRALEELKDRQRKAVEEQDLETFDQVSKEIDELISSHPALTGKPLPEPAKQQEAASGWFSQEVVDAWKAANPWYTDNPKMAVYARQVDMWLADVKPHLSQRERLEEITRYVKAEFPEYWSNPRRSAPPAVEGAEHSGRPTRKVGKTYEDLPPEAKAMCDRFCGKDGKGKTGTIPGYTREDYVRDFFSGEAVYE